MSDELSNVTFSPYIMMDSYDHNADLRRKLNLMLGKETETQDKPLVSVYYNTEY